MLSNKRKNDFFWPVKVGSNLKSRINVTVPSGTCNNRDYNNKTTIGNVWRNGGNTTPQSA